MRVCALAFLAGILLVQHAPVLMPLWAACFLVPVVMLVWFRPQYLPLAVLVFGYFWATWQAGVLLSQSVPSELEGRDVQVAGQILDIPVRIDRTTRFHFSVRDAVWQGQNVDLPQKVLLRFYHTRETDSLRFGSGENWKFTVRLKRPHGFQNPGGFDYEATLFRQGVRATGYVRARPLPQRVASEGAAEFNLAGERQWLEDQIRQRIADQSLAGMIVALANGNRNYLSDDQWQRLRVTGTNHLVAISGLHIGLVAGLIYFLVRHLWSLSVRLTLLWPSQKAAAVAALLAAVVYSAMAGFSVPTQRALSMLAIVMLAVITQRHLGLSTLLASALIVVLLVDPLSAMEFGFWLSFCAVAVIAYALQDRKQKNGLKQLAWVQWAVSVGLVPLMIVFFQTLSLTAPLANFIAVPLYSFLIVPLVLLGSLAIYVFPAWESNLLLNAAAWCIESCQWILDRIIEYGPSSWILPDPPLWAFICGVIGIFLLLAPRAWPGRWLGLIWISPLFLIEPARPGTDEVWLTLLDVGQGLAAVVRTRERTLVFDTGPRFSDRFDTGSAVVLPYLRSQGVKRIDELLVSHGDNDHIGGAKSVMAGIPVSRVRSSVPDRFEDATPCQAGQDWNWNGVRFSILHPRKGDSYASDNNGSCVLKVISRFGAVLLPGDIEADAEHILVSHYREKLGADVMVVPHHGSKTSSTIELLDAVKPDTVLIPSGYRNRYRHPHPSVEKRYQERGINMRTSPQSGAIEIRMTRQGRTISAYRVENRRYWFNQPEPEK